MNSSFANDCLPRERLEAISAGAAAFPSEAAHLSACRDCAAALERIRAENQFVREVATVVRSKPSAFQTPSHLAIPGYAILGEIRRGGQGAVYRATQLSTQREVAIKILHGAVLSGTAGFARFEREVEILARLDHRHIVGILDSGHIGDNPYLIMDLVRGVPLDEYARSAFSLVEAPATCPASESGFRQSSFSNTDLRALLTLFASICEAVNAAHLRGVIHRDLKPANVLVDAAGEPHVLDFGLARQTHTEGSVTVTREANFVGTLRWASPEQTLGEPGRIDLRTDVYSLGLILHWLLTGATPFEVSGSVFEIIERIRNLEIARPSLLRRGVDSDLDTIALRCLAKEPERRYETAGALARDVRNYLAGAPLDARRDSTWYLVRKRLRRHRVAFAGATAGLIGLIVFSIAMSVLYRRAADAEKDARMVAGRLAEQLSLANVERGRSLVLAGNVAPAEDVIWREFLLDEGATPGIEATNSTFWALLELYSRHPCVRTVTLDGWNPRTRLCGFDDATQRVQLWSPDGLLTWDAALGVTRKSLREFPNLGRLVSTADTNTHLLARYESPDSLVIFEQKTGDQECLAAETDWDLGTAVISPTGTHLALCDRGGNIRCYRFDRGVLCEEAFRVAAEPGQSTLPPLLAFTAGGRSLSALDSAGRLRCWSVDEEIGQLRWERMDSFRRPSFWRVSPDGTMLAVPQSAQQDLALASTEDGALLCTISSRDLLMNVEFMFDPTGTKIACCRDLSTDIFIENADCNLRLTRLAGHRNNVYSVLFSGDGNRLASIARDGVLKIWDLPQNGLAFRRVQRAGTVLGVAFEPRGQRLWAAEDHGRIWAADPADLLVDADWVAHAGPASSITFSPDGRKFATTGYDGTLKLWDLPDRRPLGMLKSPVNGKFVQAVFRCDGRFVAAACDDRRLYVWDIETLADPATVEFSAPVSCVAYSPDGKQLAVGDRKSGLTIFDGQTLQSQWRSAARDVLVRSVKFSPDGRLVISGGDGQSIKLWDAETGIEAGRMNGHQQQVMSLALSPTGRLLASGDASGTIMLWDLAQRRALMQLNRHTSMVFGLEFDPTGDLLASCGSDFTVQIHNLRYSERYVAGNLDAAIDRLGEGASAARIEALRGWVAEVAQQRPQKSPAAN